MILLDAFWLRTRRGAKLTSFLPSTTTVAVRVRIRQVAVNIIFTMKSLSIVLASLMAFTAGAFSPLPVTQKAHCRPASPSALRDNVPKADREWIQSDMQDAGKAEHETEDWVARDMESIGSRTGDDSSDNWIVKDMLKAGQADGSSHYPHKLKDDTVKNKRNYDIAKDMKRTGKSTDWIAQDMEQAGKMGSKFTNTEHWLNGLERALNDETRHRKEVREDMEKMGHMGSDKDKEVQADMEHTGHAQNPFEVLQDFFNSITYKLNEWTEKAFDSDTIRKDMEGAGKASDTAGVATHVKTAGREGADHGASLPDQKKDLKEDLTSAQHEKYIEKDMEREGHPGRFRSKRSEHNLYDLVYEDMKLAGSGSTSSERVRQDMEAAGHAEGEYLSRFKESKNPQYKQELETFNNMKHARPKAPVEPKKKVYAEATVEPAPEIEEKKQGFIKHLFKKVSHPRTPWREL